MFSSVLALRDVPKVKEPTCFRFVFTRQVRQCEGKFKVGCQIFIAPPCTYVLHVLYYYYMFWLGNAFPFLLSLSSSPSSSPTQ